MASGRIQGERVLVVGATGLVGQQALRQLVADPAVAEIRALVRRPCTPRQLLGGEAEHTVGFDKMRVYVTDFDRLAERASWFDVDTVFCALGTTIRQAGSRAAFRRVDFDYPSQIAQMAKAQGARRFLLVSAVGASARSRVFYNRVKGELEDAIRGLGFEHVSVAQPSLLAGERAEVRLGERLALKLGFLMPQPYKPVGVAQVATGLLQSGRQGRIGWHVLSNTALRGMR